MLFKSNGFKCHISYFLFLQTVDYGCVLPAQGMNMRESWLYCLSRLLLPHLGIWQQIGGERAGASRTSCLIDFRSGMKATESVGPSYWEASRKTHQSFFFFFSKRTEPTLFIYCLSNIVKILNQVLTAFLPLPQSAASPSQVTPSKVPSHALRSKPLKDLFDIERGRIISPSLKKRERDAAI